MQRQGDYQNEYVCQLIDKNHLQQILNIENEVHITPWNCKKFHDCFDFDAYRCIGLFENTVLRGYAVLFIHQPEAELQNFVIAKAFHNLGLGTFFLTKIIDQLGSLALNKFMLEVRASNYHAIKLYTSCGFKQVGLRKNYYKSKTANENALLFTLDL